MDEMKLKLSTKFMRNLVSKLISTVVKSKTGCQIDIQIAEVRLENKDGKTKIHLDVDGELTNEEFMKLVKKIGLD